MKKANNTPREAAAAEAAKQVTFNLNEIGYIDLDGSRIKLNFDQREFGNIIFGNSQSIEMDEIARAIHKDGVAVCRPEDARIIAAIVAQFSAFSHRVKDAINSYVNNLIGE